MATSSHLVFIDSGVLVAAARGIAPIAQRALAVLSDPSLQFASSQLVRLEVLPKAVYTNRADEIAFYQTFFDAVSTWIEVDVSIFVHAYDEAIRHGLSAVDAIHIVSAASVNADLFITTERMSKPLHRTTLVRVLSIAPEAENSAGWK